MAKQQGREMVNEARAYRERVLSELARRRELARQQIEQLMHGRDRLLQAFERSRLVAVDVMAELTPLGEPTEYVNLSPTTGPVPLMVPNMPRPGSQAAAPTRPGRQPGRARTTTQTTTTVLTLVETIEVVETDRGRRRGRRRRRPSTQRCDRPTTTRPIEPDSVVKLDISLADQTQRGRRPDREPAPVVALFDIEREPDDEPRRRSDTIDDDPTIRRHRRSAHVADDLFARLRAARAEGVARASDRRRADVPRPADTVDADAAPVDADDDHVRGSTRRLRSPSEDSVFQPTPEAPAVEDAVDDTPFARRDAALTPIIVAAARKLKRVLADEQNEVLHTLRRKEPVRTIDTMVAVEAEQATRYVSAISAELSAAAVAGAVSMGMRSSAAQPRSRRPTPPRRRVSCWPPSSSARCEHGSNAARDADGDNDEMANLVRMLYREWKTQRIDEHLDDVARTAFGRGALAAVAPGTPDLLDGRPERAACPDAEDNALAGACRRARRSPPVTPARRPTGLPLHARHRTQLTLGRRDAPASLADDRRATGHPASLRSGCGPPPTSRLVSAAAAASAIGAGWPSSSSPSAGGAAAVGRFLAGFYIDYLWHDSVGRGDVFWGMLGRKVMLFVCSAACSSRSPS